MIIKVLIGFTLNKSLGTHELEINAITALNSGFLNVDHA